MLKNGHHAIGQAPARPTGTHRLPLKAMALLFNPATYNPSSFDDVTRSQLLALVDFFETKGLARNKEEYYSGEWYADFLDLVAEKKIFATVATLMFVPVVFSLAHGRKSAQSEAEPAPALLSGEAYAAE